MGVRILNKVKEEFDYNACANSKRLTTYKYNRHLAALTLYKDSKYTDTFTYTYRILDDNKQTIELRYLSKKMATFHTCYVKASMSFVKELKRFIAINSPREEKLIAEFSNGDRNYKRYSDYFDYEFGASE